MTDRDRLAADLLDLGVKWSYVPDDVDTTWDIWTADRLIAAGWTRLDEERLARAVAKWLWEEDWDKVQDGLKACREHAAVIAKAYREDTDAHD